MLAMDILMKLCSFCNSVFVCSPPGIYYLNLRYTFYCNFLVLVILALVFVLFLFFLFLLLGLRFDLQLNRNDNLTAYLKTPFTRQSRDKIL